MNSFVRICHFITICLSILFASNCLFAEDIQKKGHALVETAILGGTNRGVESKHFSEYILVYELGYLRGAIPNSDSKWGVGGTGYFVIGENDFRFGLKPRFRYRFNSKWSTDISAGLIIATSGHNSGLIDEGFTGGINLNYSTWLALKSELMIVHEPEWQKNRSYGSGLIQMPSGNEISLYSGLAFRGDVGLIALGVSAAVGIAFIIMLGEALEGLD